MSRGDRYLSEIYKRFFYNVAYYRDLDYNQQGHIFENDFLSCYNTSISFFTEIMYQ